MLQFNSQAERGLRVFAKCLVAFAITHLRVLVRLSWIRNLRSIFARGSVLSSEHPHGRRGRMGLVDVIKAAMHKGKPEMAGRSARDGTVGMAEGAKTEKPRLGKRLNGWLDRMTRKQAERSRHVRPTG